MVGYYQIVEKGVVENTLLHSVVENTLLHSKPLSKPPLDKQECSSFKVKSEMLKRNLQSIVLRSTTVYSNSIIFYFDYVMSLDLFQALEKHFMFNSIVGTHLNYRSKLTHEREFFFDVISKCERFKSS